MKEEGKIRKFETGATRDTDLGKLDYEGFLNPLVLKAYAEYMNKHRLQSDGQLRESDNWQKGIPKTAYMKSMFRHFMDLWLEHRGYESRGGIKEALYGIIFNSMGYLFEMLKEEEVDVKKHAVYREVTKIWAILYRQKIHSKRRQGKAFEQMVSNAFKRLVERCQGFGFWFMRIYDYQTFIHLNPRFFAPKQPADFLACSEGRFHLIECKSTQQNRFNPEVFKPHQEEAMRKITDADGKYWLLILHRGKVKAEQVIYAFDYERWCKLKEAMKKEVFKTADWELLNTYAKLVFKREKGSWKLGWLFGTED